MTKKKNTQLEELTSKDGSQIRFCVEKQKQRKPKKPPVQQELDTMKAKTNNINLSETILHSSDLHGIITFAKTRVFKKLYTVKVEQYKTKMIQSGKKPLPAPSATTLVNPNKPVDDFTTAENELLGKLTVYIEAQKHEPLYNKYASMLAKYIKRQRLERKNNKRECDVRRKNARRQRENKKMDECKHDSV